MKRAILLFILAIYACPLMANQELQDELLEMCVREQDLRMQFLNNPCDDLREKIAAIDNSHLQRLQTIIQEHNWPGYDKVGEEGSHACWLLVQHTPDRIFQIKCLAHLEKAVAEENASPIDLAYLQDRVLMYAGEKQIYGTQLHDDLSVYQVKDEEQLNERRTAIGLPTMEEYIEMVRNIYGDKLPTCSQEPTL